MEKTNTEIPEEERLVYIIILNYQTWADTINLVDNLKTQAGVRLSIVIVDNKSPNNSYQILTEKYSGEKDLVVLDSGRNGGYGFGNNVGLRYIEPFDPEYVAILNNDIFISESRMFKKLTDEMELHPNATLCAPSMLVGGQRLNNAWKIPSAFLSLLMSLKYSQKFFYRFTQYKFKELKTEKVECVPGSFFVARYTKFREIGFFDENIFLFEEETVLGFLVKKAGGYNLLCRGLTYDHFLSKSVDTLHSKLSKLKYGQTSQEYFGKTYRKDWLVTQWMLKILHIIRLWEERFLSRISGR